MGTLKRVSFLDQKLRRAAGMTMVGQKNIKDNLKILLGAAKERGHT